jgi:SAM-dependent methyltransferase
MRQVDMMRTVYSDSFFKDQQAGSLRSAKHIVPLLIDLVQPTSVVDVGCGVGTWLSVCQQYGVEDIYGVDGEYVNKELLLIDRSRFHGTDLSQLLQLGRRFDLALSLEVAEHLPPHSAATFVESLTRLSSVVAFSAAVPFQGGESHLNEQWQSYWAGLFAQRNYCPVDCIRSQVWDNDAVEFWYAQNMLLYVERTALAANPRLLSYACAPAHLPLSVIHPKALTRAGIQQIAAISRSALFRRMRRGFA